MTSIPNKLTKLVKECNNTIQKSIKMKPADINQKTHINVPIEFDTKDPKFKVDNHVQIFERYIFKGLQTKLIRRSCCNVKKKKKKKERKYKAVDICDGRPNRQRNCWNVLQKRTS